MWESSLLELPTCTRCARIPTRPADPCNPPLDTHVTRPSPPSAGLHQDDDHRFAPSQAGPGSVMLADPPPPPYPVSNPPPSRAPHILRRQAPPPAGGGGRGGGWRRWGEGDNTVVPGMQCCSVVHEAHQQLTTDCPSLLRSLPRQFFFPPHPRSALRPVGSQGTCCATKCKQN